MEFSFSTFYANLPLESVCSMLYSFFFPTRFGPQVVILSAQLCILGYVMSFMLLLLRLCEVETVPHISDPPMNDSCHFCGK